MMKPAIKKASIYVLCEERQKGNAEPICNTHDGYGSQNQKYLFPAAGNKKVGDDNTD